METDSLRHAGYAAVQVSRRSLDLLDYDDVTRYAEMAAGIAERTGNDDLLVAARLTEARSYVRMGRYDDAIQLYERQQAYGSDEFQEEDYMNLGLAYLMTGQDELAAQCDACVESYESGFNTIKLNRLIMEGHAEEAVDLMSETMEKLDSVRNSVWTRNDISTVNNFYKNQDERLTESVRQSRTRSRYILAVSILLLALGGFVFLYLRQRNRRAMLDVVTDAESLRRMLSDVLSEKERTLSEKEREIGSMKARLDESDRERESLRADVSELGRQGSEMSAELLRMRKEEARRLRKERDMRKDFGQRLIDRLTPVRDMLDAYYHFDGPSTEQKIIVRTIREEVEKIIGSDSTLKDITLAVNLRYDGIIDRLREDFPNLNENHVQFFALCVLDFSNRIISLLQGTTINTTYNRRSELKKMFRSVGTRRGREYLGYL